MKRNLSLSMAQAKADLFAAEDAIKRAEALPARKAKYIKGIAGYHLQQAAENKELNNCYLAAIKNGEGVWDADRYYLLLFLYSIPTYIVL